MSDITDGASNAPTEATAPTTFQERNPGLVRTLRILALGVLWIPQPFLFLHFMITGIPDEFGFLGSVFLILPLVMLIALTAFIITVGSPKPKARKKAKASAILTALALALFIANHFHAISGLAPDIADEQVAHQVAAENLAEDLDAYRPFTGSAIARLDEPSTLQLDATDLPHMDAATALLPVASAFVTATYPEDAVTVQWDSIAGDDDAVFQYNNTTYGFEMLAKGVTDVFLGTKAGSEEEQAAAQRGISFAYAPIGREGFVFLVNAQNPVDSLTIQQVKDIYAGRITNWKEVGGNDEPIIPYQRNANSGSQSMMERFMADDALMEALDRLTSTSMGGLVRSVADYDNGAGAIGYSFRYYATDLVGEYDVKLLAIDGVEPSAENITNSTYPITGDFYAVTREGDDDAALAELVAWMQGSQGQALVRASGYATLS